MLNPRVGVPVLSGCEILFGFLVEQVEEVAGRCEVNRLNAICYMAAFLAGIHSVTVAIFPTLPYPPPQNMARNSPAKWRRLHDRSTLCRTVSQTDSSSFFGGRPMKVEVAPVRDYSIDLSRQKRPWRTPLSMSQSGVNFN